jgi:peptide/nickel transport system substrate-binding protein
MDPQDPLNPKPENPLAESTPETPTSAPIPDQPQPESAPPVTPLSQGSTPVTGPKTNGSKKWLVAALLVILILIAGAVAYLYIHKSNKPSSTSTLKKDIPLINYGVFDDQFTTFYPLGSTNTGTMAMLNSQLFEGLVGYTNVTNIAPELATNWYNTNNTTWVFNIRPGVTFHNGDLLTASDVKASLDYAIAHQNDANSTDTVFPLTNTIANVKVDSPSQVTITTTNPDPTLLNRLAQLYVFDGKYKLGDPNAGTGAYIIKPGTTPSNTDVDLAAYDKYWGGHVYTREVHLIADTNITQQTKDLQNNKFDVVGDLQSQQLALIPHKSVISYTDLGMSFLGINTDNVNSPLNSLAARQAIQYAVNPQAILKAAGLTGESQSQLVPTSITGHDPSIKPVPYDLAKAKALLSTVKNSGTQISFTYPAGDQALGTEIASELQAAGFNVKATMAASLTDALNTDFAGKNDIFYLTYTSNIFDGLDIFSNVVQNSALYDNPQIDKLATQANGTLDPSTRIKLLQQIGQQVAKDVPDVPLYSVFRQYALLKPYHLQVDQPNNDLSVYFWKVYQ